MNANTSFRLEPPPTTNLSRLDLTDFEYARDAQHGLERCVTDADYTAWAKRWGEALVAGAVRSVTIGRRISNTKKLRS